MAMVFLQGVKYWVVVAGACRRVGVCIGAGVCTGSDVCTEVDIYIERMMNWESRATYS